jgi:glycosyltransferase involved in cell wall biosynthesis
MRVAIITPAIHDPERLFGAERLFSGLVGAFQSKAQADWIQVPISEKRLEGILQGYLDCFDLDLSAYDLVVSTKNPTFAVQHPNHVCWLVHQVRVFYDRFDDEFGSLPDIALLEKTRGREVIQRLDTLSFQRVRKIFSIGHEPARRLQDYNGFAAEVLYPPAFTQGHYCGSQNYFFLPGRLHRWKRVDLAIQAMGQLTSDIPLLIAGTGEDEDKIRQLASKDSRIHLLGFVSDAEMLKLYSDSLAVVFPTREEDFGYVAVEAMLSHKPVIVCKDSGEPARLVQNNRSGFVVDPDPLEIARAMNVLATDRDRAREMGDFGYHSAPSQSWDEVTQRLLNAGSPLLATKRGSRANFTAEANSRIPILVADNQVLDPPVGGGRIRIYELYRHIAALGFEVSYVGAYDWPGPVYRDQMLAPYFRERVTPLTQPHFARNRRIERATGGKTTIDVTIPKLLKYSPRFQRMAAEHGRNAAAVIISHPWVYPYVPRRLDQALIYDSHNCEYVVKKQILADTAAGQELVEEARSVEGKLCGDADLIFVCSNDDGKRFVDLYGISRDKIVLVPNGVDVESIQPASEEERKIARRQFDLPPDQPVLIFIGSGYAPNTEAAAFLVKEIASRLPDCTIMIAGGVKDSYQASRGARSAANVIWLGTVDAARRLSLYQAADIALNPMFSGSGTNLKMLDYFAAGLPVVSTPEGARGLELKDDDCVVCSSDQFVFRIEELTNSPATCRRIGENARKLAIERYAWSLIATHASEAILSLLKGKFAHVS